MFSTPPPKYLELLISCVNRCGRLHLLLYIPVTLGPLVNLYVILWMYMPPKTNTPVFISISDFASHGGFLESGVRFWGSHKEDCSILGSTLGSPYCGKLPHEVVGIRPGSLSRRERN